MPSFTFPVFAYVAPALPTTISTEVTIELIEQEAIESVTRLGTKPQIAALAAAAAIGVYSWFRSMGPGSSPLGGPSNTKEDSKKVMRVLDALKIVEEEMESISGFGFWVPVIARELVLGKLRKRIREAALGQSGHTVKMRVYRGKRGRPPKGTPGFVMQYLRP